FDRITVLHPGAFEEPVLFVHAGPIGASVRGAGRPRPHETPRIWPVFFPFAIVDALTLGVDSGELSDPADRAVGRARGVRKYLDHAVDRISAEEGGMGTRIYRALDVLKHVERPVLVVPDGEEHLSAREPARVGVRVHVRDVRDVVAGLLHPEGQGELPEKECTGTLGQRRVEDLPVLAVWPVEADPHTGARVPVVRRGAVVVERPEVGPAVVRRPRSVRALKEEVALAVVPDAENHVALEFLAVLSQLV